MTGKQHGSKTNLKSILQNVILNEAGLTIFEVINTFGWWGDSINWTKKNQTKTGNISKGQEFRWGCGSLLILSPYKQN